MRAPSWASCWTRSGCQDRGQVGPANDPRIWWPTAATATPPAAACYASVGSPTPSRNAPTSGPPVPGEDHEVAAHPRWIWCAIGNATCRAVDCPAQTAPRDRDQVRQAGRQLPQLAGPGRHPPLAPNMNRQTDPSRAVCDMVLASDVWPGGLPCPCTRGTVDTVACRKAARGKRPSQRSRPCSRIAGRSRLRCRVGWRRLRLGVGHASTVRPDSSTLGVLGERGSHRESCLQLVPGNDSVHGHAIPMAAGRSRRY
jgi:hypothetical protein